jgi:hypothetical protein
MDGELRDKTEYMLRKAKKHLEKQLTDDYMIGLYNGCELALAAMQARKPEYVTYDMVLKCIGQIHQDDAGNVYPNKLILNNQLKVMDALVVNSVKRGEEKSDKQT